MSKNPKQAILFFSRTAEEEAAHKRFNAMLSQKGNVAIGQQLINSTLETLANCQVPLISCFSSQQKGSSFGERLANAIEDVFHSGYEQVIIVGNDCPSISEKLIHDSFESIEEGQMVLGPASDGGVYLLGFHKSLFDKSKFIKLTWEQADLQTSFKNYITDLEGQVHWLEEQVDIDGAIDLQAILNALPKCSVLKIKLNQILSGFVMILIQRLEKILFSAFHSSKIQLRGPPSFYC